MHALIKEDIFIQLIETFVFTFEDCYASGIF